MTDQLTQWVEAVMTMPWLYPLVSLFVAIDALVPLIPSETVLNLAGAWAGATGRPNLGGVFWAAMVGGILGDNVLFFLGRRYGSRINQFRPNSKPGRAVNWVKGSLRKNAGATIIIARFIPWGRWVTTLLLGSVSYSWLLFVLYDVLGLALWAGVGLGVGFAGGMLFQDAPLLALVVGIVAGTAVGLAIQRLQLAVLEWMDERRGQSKA
ncbi:DedA family protein [Corynebacterium tapiri]|uniref:DedA family protein n=2 Tax=Corynebacterium tapiri TaxID=1448266 RepID=A0A5C4U3R6_9CORY|nr:DedA family protein [Corynebacterium tapiri]